MKKGIIHGWGINNADYPVTTKVDWKIGRYQCCHYRMWTGAICRSKSPVRFTNKNLKKYINTTISEDWKLFMDFREWSIANGLCEENRNYMELDKDILIPGNDHYSPETCCIVPRYLNLLLLGCDSNRGKYPMGVCLHQGKVYMAQVAVKGVGTRLGTYSTKEKAHQVWQLAKAKIIDDRVQEYRSSDVFYREDVAQAFLMRSKQLREDAKNGVETIKL